MDLDPASPFAKQDLTPTLGEPSSYDCERSSHLGRTCFSPTQTTTWTAMFLAESPLKPAQVNYGTATPLLTIPLMLAC